MRKIFFVVVALGATITTNAQLREKVIVKAGGNVPAAVSPNGYYRFPDYTEGVLMMQDGRKSTALFNYHYVTGEVLYVSKAGDTLALGAPEEMARVVIAGKTQFVYDNKSYLEVLGEGQSYRLAKKVKVSMDNDKKGAFGQSAFNASQDQLTNIYAPGNKQLYDLAYDVAVSKTTSFFWVDSKNDFQLVSKKSSLKLVSKDKQSKLEAYIDDNKINFNREDDLRKLLAFADSL